MLFVSHHITIHIQKLNEISSFLPLCLCKIMKSQYSASNVRIYKYFLSLPRTASDRDLGPGPPSLARAPALTELGTHGAGIKWN